MGHMKPLLETLTAGASYLSKRGIDEARLNMEHLLAHVLQCRRMDLYLRFDQLLKEDELEPLRGLLKRRGEGEPLQHLLGTVEFYGLELISDHRALVPRPETELLVDMLVKDAKATAPPARVLDMATGSGCIGLSLATVWPNSSVMLADVSEDALELARFNASRLNLNGRVKLLRTDLFEKVTGEFDLIVANLPYIPSAEIATLSREVKRDPALALDGGPSGLEIVERFLKEIPLFLAAEGRIALEVGHDQGHRTAELCREAGFAQAEVRKDLANVERLVFAKR
ncbi:MAG: Release factor glutamine methyltransferase [Verrucomicrobiaceae bacterium]|nr:Release factor glutamine methyltransferase [Verrucomicrobiaceae bacterium]MDB6119206.1 Release factor glutamine methyltransferase [Verrucomicrobiaceae bacterium]